MPRLLIVDDALIMRKMIREVATAAGWEVVGEAANGRDAVATYRELRPDLVTLDLIMPVMGGFEALRELRSLDPEARVVIVSAIDQRQALVEAIAAGAIDFIVKPFERERVVGVLTKVGASIDAARGLSSTRPS
jgi:two-component system chemotaxis response regulator CheY